MVMKEYYKNPEETKKSFIDDWFLTGDLGFMDEENYVFVLMDYETDDLNIYLKTNFNNNNTSKNISYKIMTLNI